MQSTFFLILHLINPNAPSMVDMIADDMARTAALAVYASAARSFTDDPRDAETAKIYKVA